MDFVTLQQAKDHLRVDGDDSDSDINLKIKAASAAVANYLKDATPYTLDVNNNPTDEVKEEVQIATLILLGEFFDNREADADVFEMGYLPRPVTAILYPLRVPTLK